MYIHYSSPFKYTKCEELYCDTDFEIQGHFLEQIFQGASCPNLALSLKIGNHRQLSIYAYIYLHI